MTQMASVSLLFLAFTVSGGAYGDGRVDDAPRQKRRENKGSYGHAGRLRLGAASSEID